MSKSYYLSFGTDDPRQYCGLTPTFLIFASGGLTALTPPGITECLGASGMYRFDYTPSLSIVFLADGGTLVSGGRYRQAAIDPIQAIDQQLSTSGASYIGTPADSFGSTAIDPSTLFGMLKRLQELYEGNQVYAKASGILDIYSRGSSTLLREKALVNNTTQASRS